MPRPDSNTAIEVHVRKPQTSCAPHDALVSFLNRQRPVLLESVCRTGGYGRFSIVAADPLTELEVRPTRAFRHRNPFGSFAPVHRIHHDQATSIPFSPGWIGCIGYELGAAQDGIFPAQNSEPGSGMRMALYDTLAVFDHDRSTWSLIAADLPGSFLPAQERLETWEASLASVASSLPRNDPLPAAPCRAVADQTREAYIRRVLRAQEYIAAGDIYQVNLSQQFVIDTPATPWELYRRLRTVNPAAFSAYVPYDDEVVISVSPELFLDVQNRSVVTRPIKGTRPRTGAEDADAAARVELNASEKERAELNMIVDLLRNDLGRVSDIGSVEVVSSGDIEAHPTVYHRVATIRSRLREDASLADLLAATCPGGSITGCPKIRAMQIIRELEPSPRNVYCGAIGRIGLDGGASLNIAIRTIRYVPTPRGGRVYVSAGGAITADSDPEAEYLETLAKARGIFRALGVEKVAQGHEMESLT